MGKDTNEIRKLKISSAIRGTKEIAELPKNAEWASDESYCREVVEHIVEICERYGMLPTVSHLASALGIPKQMVTDVRDGMVRVSPAVLSCVTGYYALCENATVASTMDGGTNNIAGIFILKSQYGYKEEPREVVMMHNRIVGDRKDPAAIAQRYADAMVVDAKEVREVTEGTEGEYDW